MQPNPDQTQTETIESRWEKLDSAQLNNETKMQMDYTKT